MDEKPIKPGSDSERRDDEQIAAARRQAEAWTPPASETETTPAVEGGEVPVRIRDLPADSFPGYEIVKEVHRGGQGVVYLAVQKATRRKVAIKVMHEGPFAGPRDRARFEREVQILAALKHPNIVSIHDSGTAAGCFFYVMDYISGLPLDQYMANGEKSIEDTLKLFAKICEAVNAAHLKGVIHRDLKPGNIRIDTKGEPHVLDFGLAKVAMGDTTNDSRPAVMSMTGQFIGSLPWASPEQAEAIPDKIDIRTDVYSLGVILYQMLTGRFPYEVVGNMRDVLDRILKAEPTRPSTIRRQINDEVETIALKCLQKERERRYQSAGELARDITRYLAGEPIEAKRDSALYVLRKSLRRHSGPVAAACAFVILLAVFGIVMLVQAERNRRLAQSESRAKEQALVAKNEAISARDEAEIERRGAEEQRQLAEGRLLEATAAREAETQARLGSQRQSYIANLSAADLSIRANEVVEARRRLAMCDPSLRGWEWDHLALKADCRLAVLMHDAPVEFIAASSDGVTIVSIDAGKTVRVWEPLSGRLIATVPQKVPGDAHALAFSGDGKLAAWWTRPWPTPRTNPNTLWVSDALSGEILYTCEHSRAVDGANFAAGGSVLVTWTRDAVFVWDAIAVEPNKKPQRVFERAGESDGYIRTDVRAATLSADGSRVFETHNTSTYFWRDAISGRVISTGRIKGTATYLVSAPSGGLIAAAIASYVQLFPVDSNEPTKWSPAHEDGISSIAFAPDGYRFVTGSQDTTVRIWRTQDGQALATLRGHDRAVNSVLFSPDGTWVASASMDRTIRVWDPTYTDAVREHMAGGVVALSPDGRRLASAAAHPYFGRAGMDDNVVTIWESDLGEPLLALRGHNSPVSLLAWSPTGVLLASASYEANHISLWDASAGKVLMTLAGHPKGVVALVFSRDGHSLASRGRDGSVKLWDPMTGQETLAVNGAEGTLGAVGLSPDGTRVVATSLANLKEWDTASGAPRSFEGAGEPVCLAFSPDGKSMVSGNRDGSIDLWDYVSGTAVSIPGGHQRAVHAVAFNLDGSRLMSASRDGTVRIWDVTSGELLLALRANEELWSLAVSPDGKRIFSGGLSNFYTWETAAPAATFTARMKCAAIRRQAEAIIDPLLAEYLTVPETIEQLRADHALSEPVREAAILLVTIRGSFSKPVLLNAQSWHVVKSPVAGLDDLHEALRKAQAASRLEPDNGLYLNTLGVAQYRLGEYEQALAKLTRSDELTGGHPSDIAFIAMSLRQLGRTDEARAALDRLQKLMAQDRWAKDEESQGFLCEAEALLLGMPASQPAANAEPGPIRQEAK